MEDFVPPAERPASRDDMINLTMFATELHRNHKNALSRYSQDEITGLAFALRRLINSHPEIE